MLQSLVPKFCIETASAVSRILYSQYKIITESAGSPKQSFSLKTERKVLQSSAEVQLSKRLTLLRFFKHWSFYKEQPFPSFKLPTVI